MSENSVYGYAVFVDNNFEGIFYYPTSDSAHSIMITAALQSNPTITLDDESETPNAYRYSVFVEDDYVGKIYLRKEIDGYDVAKINNALQNNPTLVWINSNTLPRPETKWSYDGNTLTLIEE